MNEKELVAQCYHTVYQGMIQKDMSLLNEVLDESFILVHMTGMQQTKKQYMDYIANGTLNYYSEKTQFMDVTVYGDTAKFTGQSKVNAAVFGGDRHLWRLQLSMKAVKRNGNNRKQQLREQRFERVPAFSCAKLNSSLDNVA